MRQLFLIQTHRDPDQLLRLVGTLQKGCADAIVLVSHNPNGTPLPPSLFDGQPNVHVIRGRGGRGDFSILHGYLGAVRWLRDNRIDYDWLTNLSGQDYPAASLARFAAELSEAEHDGFLHHFDVLEQKPDDMAPMVWPPRHGYERYYYRYTKLKDDLSLTERAALRIPRLAAERFTDRVRINTAYGLLIGRPADRTPFTAEFRCYAGSYWHTLRRRCVDYLLDFCEHRPDVVEYFHSVLIPDEAFIHTILVNNRNFRFENDSRRYFDMRGSRRGHPKILTEDDIPEFAGGRYVFARKIEWAGSAALLDRLDGYALEPARELLASA
jgi:hypothetical protein